MSLDEVKQIVRQAKNIVFFGGAGVSTESGIPDFRGNGGLYTERDGREDRPEEILRRDYLFANPRGFYSYYLNNMLYPDAEPNEAHRALAELERRGQLTAVITQNIDGLHQAAGNRNVIELHGSTLRNYCTKCGKQYPRSFLLEADGIPRCTVCGDAYVRPDVVLYGEPLDGEAFGKAETAVENADVMIVGGTSLTVYPAASLVDLYQGEHLIIINRTRTPYDEYAEYVIRDSIGETLSKLVY